MNSYYGSFDIQFGFKTQISNLVKWGDDVEVVEANTPPQTMFSNTLKYCSVIGTYDYENVHRLYNLTL